jgi:hypothetical protein
MPAMSFSAIALHIAHGLDLSSTGSTCVLDCDRGTLTPASRCNHIPLGQTTRPGS